MPPVIPTSADEQVKRCCGCRLPVLRSEFNRRARAPDGLASYCRKCTKDLADTQRARRRANGKTAAYHQRRGDAFRATVLKRNYDMTPGDYSQLLEEQGGACAICGENESDRAMSIRLPTADGSQAGRNAKRLAVDHDHDSGVVRGLLCSRCNRAMGGFGDCADLLEKAAAYLRKHESPTK